MVNQVTDLDPLQTTVMLVAGSAARGHETWVFGVDDLRALPDGCLQAAARRVLTSDAPDLTGRLAQQDPAPVTLDALDLVVLRTNPGRDKRHAQAHQQTLRMLTFLNERGVPVVNDPDGARLCGSKLFLQTLPAELRPRSLVSCDPGALEAFVHESREATVLKPLDGTWGADVYRVAPQHPELASLIHTLLDQGYVIAQEFLPDVTDGDVRLLLLEGRPLLSREGRPAAVRRLPPPGDFRSNIHLGGTPTPVPELTPELQRVADEVGPLLAARGVVLAGVDVVGDRILEVNAYAPGGLGDAQMFQDADFLTPILDAFEARCAVGC
jgi:glutathione synthase